MGERYTIWADKIEVPSPIDGLKQKVEIDGFLTHFGFTVGQRVPAEYGTKIEVPGGLYDRMGGMNVPEDYATVQGQKDMTFMESSLYEGCYQFNLITYDTIRLIAVLQKLGHVVTMAIC